VRGPPSTLVSAISTSYGWVHVGGIFTGIDGSLLANYAKLQPWR